MWKAVPERIDQAGHGDAENTKTKALRKDLIHVLNLIGHKTPQSEDHTDHTDRKEKGLRIHRSKSLHVERRSRRLELHTISLHIIRETKQDQVKRPIERRVEPGSFPRRFVTFMANTVPFRVGKRLVRSDTVKGTSSHHTESILRLLSGEQDLKNVLVLLTPPSSGNRLDNTGKLHCYALDTHRHLCVFTVTQEERDRIVAHHSRYNYTLLFSNRYIDLQDAARNTPIKAAIFRAVRKASKAVCWVWYQDNYLNLKYQRSKRGQEGIRSTRNPFAIRRCNGNHRLVNSKCNDSLSSASVSAMQRLLRLETKRKKLQKLEAERRKDVRMEKKLPAKSSAQGIRHPTSIRKTSPMKLLLRKQVPQPKTKENRLAKPPTEEGNKSKKAQVREVDDVKPQKQKKTLLSGVQRESLRVERAKEKERKLAENQKMLRLYKEMLDKKLYAKRKAEREQERRPESKKPKRSAN